MELEALVAGGSVKPALKMRRGGVTEGSWSVTANRKERRHGGTQVMFVGNARATKEVAFRSLEAPEAAQFRASMAKEWSTWQQFGVAKPVEPEELERLRTWWLLK